jgi:hypothetical protein
MSRWPLFFKRRKYSKVKALRLIAFDKLSLPMTGYFVLYRSADAEAVMHITARVFFCVCQIGHSLWASDPTRLCVRKAT